MHTIQCVRVSFPSDKLRMRLKRRARTATSFLKGFLISSPHAIDELNASIIPRRLLELIDYQVDKLQESGETIRGFCPIHGEGVFRTLLIDKVRKTYRCLYGLCDGQAGGTLVELYALSKKMPLEEAAAEIAKALGIEMALAVDDEYLAKNAEIADNFLALGAMEEAEKEFLQLVKLRPDFKRGHEALLHIYGSAKNVDRMADEHEALARLSLQSREYGEALSHARSLADLRPDAMATHQLLGQCYIEAYDREGAVGEFMAVAEICEGQGNYDAAIEAYLKVEELGSEQIDVSPHIVRAYLHAGRQQQAMEYVVTRGERAAQAGEYARATELYAAMLEMDNPRPEMKTRFIEIAALSPIGEDMRSRMLAVVDDLLATEGQRERGIAALEKMLDVPATNAAALQKLMGIYRSQGKEREALRLQVRSARSKFDGGDSEAAIAQLHALLELSPTNVEALQAVVEIETARKNMLAVNDALRRLAEIYVRDRAFEQAVETYDRILLSEDTLDVREQRAKILEAWGTTEKPAVLDEASRAYEDLAKMYNDATTGRRAMTLFERAAELGTARPEPLLAAAAAYRRHGDRQKARDTIMRACDLLSSLSRYDEALAHAEEFIALMPEDLELAGFVAELYARRGNRSEAARRLAAIAYQMQQGGNSQEAEKALQRAIALDPDDDDIMEELAELYRRRGEEREYIKTMYRLANGLEQRQNWKRAVETIEKIVQHLPAEIPAINRLIAINEQLGETGEAQRWRVHLAKGHRERGDREREIRVLREALVKSPEDHVLLKLLVECEFARYDVPAASTAARRLAAVERKLGKDEDALETLIYATEQAPDHIELHQDLFAVLCDTGKRLDAVPVGLHLVDLLTAVRRDVEAAQVYEKLASCDPENITIKLSQIAFLKQAGMIPEAVDRMLAMFSYYRVHESLEDAEQTLNQVLEIDPANLRAHEELAALYELTGNEERLIEHLPGYAEAAFESGQPEKAVAAVQRVIAHQPGNASVRRQLVRYYIELGQAGDAIRELLGLANMLRQDGGDEAAIEVEREAAGLAPDNTQVRRRLADGLSRAGDSVQAAAQLEQLASAQIEKSKFTEALQTVNEWVLLAPDSLNARRTRADLYARMGDEGRALDEYRALSMEMELEMGAATGGSTEAAGSEAGTRMQSAAAQRFDGGLQVVQEYDFESFVVGPNNNFAYATALAVARAPARAYNPLFIYSDVGLGKTHLANAIANYALAQNSTARIIYTNTEDFTGELVEAISNNSVMLFRSRYKSGDLLIVDDVQFLAGRERAQEEFFHIFNALFQAKKQIVVTSDRPPKDIARLENRLLSRFGAGVIVDVQAPDLETRTAILNREITSLGVELDPWVAPLIAERIDSNVRELKGALTQVLAVRDIRGMHVTEDNVRGVLDAFYAKA